MKFIFIADFFVEHILGGGELNNEECIEQLVVLGHSVDKIQSHMVTADYVNTNKYANFIVGNFINLRDGPKQALLDTQYVIYEHDHKYLKSRNPAVYENFIAPDEHLVNLEFYRKAKGVLCQSQFHLDIIKKNTDLSNLVNLSGNLWSVSALNMLEELAHQPKQGRCSIMDSAIPHKNTAGAIKLCVVKNLEYELIHSGVYRDFLSALGANEKFVFLPQTPETLSRVAVEARMMNMSLMTNNMLGATREPWFQLKGGELIEVVREMRNTIPAKVMEAFE